MNSRLRSFAVFFNELRAYCKWLAWALAATTVVLFFLSGQLLAKIQGGLGEKLYFFAVADPFLAHVELAFFGALYLLIPLILTVLWKALGKPFGLSGKKLLWFVIATCVLFYGGTLFCGLVTLPYGIQFLLSYQSEELQAYISVDRFVSFVTLFLFGFGLIFELPAFMLFSVQVGVVSRRTYEKNRRYAILVIAILAAVLTPTPDVVNMALMGLPLYLLYESGILLMVYTKAGDKKAAPPEADCEE